MKLDENFTVLSNWNSDWTEESVTSHIGIVLSDELADGRFCKVKS